MTTTTTETRKSFPGFPAVKVEITETDEFRGEQLGADVRGDSRIEDRRTDHIETVSDTAIRFDFGWVPKSRIAALVWEKDAGGQDAATVRRVKFAR